MVAIDAGLKIPAIVVLVNVIVWATMASIVSKAETWCHDNYHEKAYMAFVEYYAIHLRDTHSISER